MIETLTARILLAVDDRVERERLVAALRGAGIAAIHEELFPGEGLEEAARRAGADFAVADGRLWEAGLKLGFHPRGGLMVVLLLDPEAEERIPTYVEAGLLECFVRWGEGWEAEFAWFCRALAGLRRRFVGAFGALERRYEDLVHALPDIVYELDEEGRFTFVNESVRLLGYDPAELAGEHFSRLLHEEDSRAVDREQVLSLFRGVRTGPALSPKLFNERRGIDRRTENLEIRLRRKPGRPAEDMIGSVISYGEVTAAGEYARDENGLFLGSVGVIRDITLRRKSEEMLRKLYQAVDQLSAGVLVAACSFAPGAAACMEADEAAYGGAAAEAESAEGAGPAPSAAPSGAPRGKDGAAGAGAAGPSSPLVEYVNPAFLKMSGLGPGEVLGRPLLSFFGFAPKRASEIASLVSDGFDASEEVLLPQPGGAGLHVAIRASPVRDPHGEVGHVILVCEDVSGRRAMEELLRVAKEEAERAGRAKSDFLASMGHELKSPVAAILAAARLVEMGGPEPEKRAGTIIASAQGLMELIGDILDFVRFETGAASLRRLDFPLRAFVARACAPRRAEAEAKGLAFETAEIPDELVRGDPDRLGRAFGAVLDNAVAFTNEGSVRVRASLERKPGNVPHLRLTVADSGIGIAPEDQGRIFAPFVQLASPYTKRGGAGIGLSLARNIVRAAGGELRLESEPGRGSTFTILVPAGEVDEPVPREALPASRGPWRILVVDDNEVNLEYMAAILGAAGHRVDLASSGAEALRALESRPVDAAVLDIQMPGMSGIELGARIRAYAGDRYDHRLPLLALTAFDPEEVLRSAVAFDEVFTKPVDLGLLQRSLAEALERAEAEPEGRFAAAWSERPSAGAALLREAEARVPGLLVSLERALAEARAEEARQAALGLANELAELGAATAAGAARRLALSAAAEDAAVTAARALRLRAAWEAARAAAAASLAAGGGKP